MMRTAVAIRPGRITAATVLWMCSALCSAQPTVAQAGAPTVGRPVVLEQPAVSSAALQSAGAPRIEGAGMRVISLSLRNVTLDSALTAIRAQAGVPISYGELVAPLKRRVTLVADQITVVDALHSVLRGTDAALLISPTGKFEIVRARVVNAASGQQGGGVVIGKVIDGRTKEGIPGVTVVIADAPKSVNPASTRARDGGFLIGNVPGGTHTIVARRLGYLSQAREIKITPGDTTRMQFELTAVPSILQGVVTTGAGDRSKLEVGNSISTINADSVVRTTPIRNISDLLKGRAAGLDVLTVGGTVGSGSKIRIRGESSMISTEDPVVIVDGVRFDAAYTKQRLASGFPGQTGYSSPSQNPGASYVPMTSRLDDIDPESIESIDVLKGPAASALYGSDAAAGVIVIKTKRGRAGPTRWSMSGQSGMSDVSGKYAENYYGWGRVYGSIPSTTSCTLKLIAMEQCEQDSVTHFNPLNHSDTSPFTTGHASQLNGQVSGGVDRVQYFVNATYDDETGILQFPSSLRAVTLQALNGNPMPAWADKPNVLNSTAVSSNLTTQFSKADLALSGNARRQYHRDVETGALGFVNTSTDAPGYRDTLSQGWGTSPASDFLTRNDDQVSRGYGSLSGNWRPTALFTAHGTGGVDYYTTDAQVLLPTNDLTLTGVQSKHNRTLETSLIKTADGNATLEIPVGSALAFRTTGGAQYTGTDISELQTTASNLQPGNNTVNGAGTAYVSEFNGQQATAGWYVQEVASLNQRLFVTAAIRGDASSAFGGQAKEISYPKWNASWLVSEEPFFPHVPTLTSFRLRVGYGHAGTVPPFDAQYRTFRYDQGWVSGSTNYIDIASVGNPDLRPERSIETEGGFDLGLGDDRVTFGLTLANKITRDALVSRTLPPSFGTSASQMQNIGKVSNHNLEFEASIRPLVSPALSWNATFTWNENSNKVLSLGDSPPTPSSQYTSSPQNLYVVGYPVDGQWTRTIVNYGDANHNGVLELNEIQLSDSVAYAGHPSPSHHLGWQNNLAFLSGRFSIGANFTYEGGAEQYNELVADQCYAQTCRAAVDPSTPLAEQVLAANVYSAWPYLEHTSVFRLEELSLTLEAPASITRALRSQRATISLMGRNLKFWTHYRGIDPDINTLGFGGDIIRDDGGVAQPRSWTLRVNLGY